MQKVYYRFYRFLGNSSCNIGYGGTLDRYGRYFIQAERQIAGNGVELFKMGQPNVPTVHEFRKKHLKSGQTLGFDGRTVSAKRQRS